MGLEVVELDRSAPFTAARARNAGFDRLLATHPGLDYVQFVDGDCELAAGWLETAARTLAEQPQLAAVCGRLRERAPDASVFNLLCDLEWDQPLGETEACGGTVMIRVSAFCQVARFNPRLIAGEEPELCLRLRRQGWKILRLAAEMAQHDAAMRQVGQWWRRNVRSGFAYAEGCALHGRSADRYRVRETARIWLWGAALPLLAVGLTGRTRGRSLALMLAYAVPGYRAYRSMRARGRSVPEAGAYGLFCLLAKFPELAGQLAYWRARFSRSPRTLIEYRQSGR
jgi:hypothetical protein